VDMIRDSCIPWTHIDIPRQLCEKKKRAKRTEASQEREKTIEGQQKGNINPEKLIYVTVT